MRLSFELLKTYELFFYPTLTRHLPDKTRQKPDKNPTKPPDKYFNVRMLNLKKYKAFFSSSSKQAKKLQKRHKNHKTKQNIIFFSFIRELKK